MRTFMYATSALAAMVLLLYAFHLHIRHDPRDAWTLACAVLMWTIAHGNEHREDGKGW